jgi:hypothetical protein
MALPIYIQNIYLKAKKINYGNSNISPCKNIPNLQKFLKKKNQNPSQILEL